MSVSLVKPARPSVVPPDNHRFTVELRRSGTGYPLVIRPVRTV